MTDVSLENIKINGESDQQPQVTSSDPKDRKLARQIRIKNRLENIKKQLLSVKYDIDEESQKTLCDKQIEKSAGLLDELIFDGDKVVTNICIEKDAGEVNRREQEGERRAKLVGKIEKEAKEAKELYYKIYEKWDKIKNCKNALNIYEALSLQKQKCEELISRKDEIIAMLRKEINIAEKDFIEKQVLHHQDIDELVKNIREEVVLMRNAYKNELKLIEAAVDADRNKLVESYNKNRKVLYKQREEKEESNIEKKLEYIKYYKKLANQAKLDHLEAYRETNINLQPERHALYEDLEKLRATCLLNIEKLKHNYQILQKRETENAETKIQQKRKLGGLRDEIVAIRKRISEFKKAKAQQIDTLSDHIHKLRNSIFELETKADHFSQNNDTKYHQVWALNEENVKGLIEKIVEADKIIHTDIVGLDWRRSKLEFAKKCDLASYKNAQAIIKSNYECTGVVKKRISEISDISKNIIDVVLEKIAVRSGFMVEKRLEEILPKYGKTEQQLIRIDNVFSGMEIKNVDEMKLLMKFFIPFVHCPTCEENINNVDDLIENLVTIEKVLLPTSSALSIGTESSFSQTDSESSVQIKLNKIKDVILSEVQAGVDVLDVQDEEKETLNEAEAEEEEEGSVAFLPDKSIMAILPSTKRPSYMVCQFNHPLMIEYRYVIHALKDYVIEMSEKKNKKKPLLADIQKQTRLTSSRLMDSEDVKFFWNQFRVVFGETDKSTWETILTGIEKYYNILRERHKLSLEVKQLQKMNAELRNILRNCSSTKMNTTENARCSRLSPKFRNL